jgi:FtsP/CotA-like multicopper oxidase with cupredoxin domain
MMVAAPGVFAAAGFGDSNGPDGSATRPQTYYAHTPTGKRIAVPTGPNARPAVSTEAAALMGSTYDGNTGAALHKFIDPLPLVGVPQTLFDGITSKYIPAAVPVKWVKPDGTSSTVVGGYVGDDYYEIAVVEYKEKMHSDLKNATTVRGYVQIDQFATNGLTAPSGWISKAVSLKYPNGSAIMVPKTDANGQLLKTATGALIMTQAKAVDNPHYLGPAIVATRNVAARVKFHNLLPVGRYNASTGRNGDLFIPVDETLAGAGVGPDGVTRYTQNRAELHLHGGDTPWISDGTPHQWIAPAGERPLLAAEMAAAGSPLSVDTFMRGPSAQNVPDMNEPGEGAVTYYFPNRQSARLEWYHDHSYGLTRLNAYAGEAAPYVVSEPAQDAMLASGVAGFPSDTIYLVVQDKTFVPEDIKLQDGRWNARVNAAGKNVPFGSTEKPLWGEASDLWYPHVYEVNQDPSNGLDGTNPVGRWDWGPYFWPVFPSLYNLPTGAVEDVTLTPEAWMDTPVINGVAYPTLTVEPRAQRFKL